MAVFSLVTIECGVPFGTTKPFQPMTSKSGRPDWAIAGMPGTNGDGLSEVTPIPRTVSPAICDCAVEAIENIICTAALTTALRPEFASRCHRRTSMEMQELAGRATSAVRSAYWSPHPRQSSGAAGRPVPVIREKSQFRAQDDSLSLSHDSTSLYLHFRALGRPFLWAAYFRPSVHERANEQLCCWLR